MTFEPLNDRLLHQLERSRGLSPSFSSNRHQPPSHDHSPGAPAPSAGSPAPLPTVHLLSDIPSKPLTWLWPGRIPLGHLTLLDGASASGLTLLALTLAACVSSGSPLPDSTPTQAGNVILLAPYDCAADTLKPRLQAAGGDPAHVLLLRPLLQDASRTLARIRSFALPHDLDHLATIIGCLNARLVILDPASALAGLSRCLPALIELAHQTTCAILLTRSLRQPPADPLHAPGPPSPLLQAARSRLLLTPDPGDERHHLLLTTRHPLCTQPSILAYDILSSQGAIPSIHWLGERDHSQLARLCNGPLRCPHRQAILRFLHHSATAHRIPDILHATSYDYDAGRKMLVRMHMAGELVSPARGLYTTANHPCLLHATDETPAVPNVPTVPSVPASQNPPRAHSPQSDIPAVSVPDHPTSTIPPVPSVPASQSSPLAHSPQSNVPAVSVTDHPISTIPPVPNVPNSAHSTSEVAQPQRDASPVPDAADEASSSVGLREEGTLASPLGAT